MSKQTEFNIEAFNPSEFSVLGSGLWGDVIDLGDGSVLKLARQSCAGIGDGRVKIAREYEILREIESAGRSEELLVPKALGWGDIPANTKAASSGCSLWLRITRIPGSPYKVAQLARLENTELDRIGAEIGLALARLHIGFRQIIKLPPESIFESVYHAAVNDEEVLVLIEKVEKALSRTSSQILLAPIHGDFNISNLLFEQGRLTGIVDFAEARSLFPEKDVSDLLKEVPALRPSLVAAYQEGSGTVLFPERITLGLAVNGVFGYLISKRLGEEGGAQRQLNDLRSIIEAKSEAKSWGGL